MTLPKNIFPLLTLLLFSGNAFGIRERGFPPQRRRVAVSGQNSGVIMGSEEIFTLPVKSAKAKDSKSEKSTKQYGIDLSMSMSMSMSMSLNLSKATKSGKSAKDAKAVDNSKGSKGGKGSKGFKSEKSAKEGKSGKSNKKAKSPVFAPSTPSPTSADSISEKSWPYAITYAPSSDIPSSKDLQELTMLTQKYLEDYMIEFFSKTSLTDLDNFLTIMEKNAFIEGEPVSAEYQSNGLFDPDSIFTPTKREITDLVEDAITQGDYLELVQTLPRSNPFRDTESITFTILETTTASTGTPGDSGNGSKSDESSGSGSAGSSSSAVRAGVAAAAAGVLVLAASLALIRSRKPSRNFSFDEEEDVEDFSANKMTTEDRTTAGQTFLSRDDSTSHFAHWRAAKTYSQQGSEFVEEAIDGDDNLQRMRS